MTADVIRDTLTATSEVRATAAKMDNNVSRSASAMDRNFQVGRATFETRGTNTDLTRVAFAKDLAKEKSRPMGDRTRHAAGFTNGDARPIPRSAETGRAATSLRYVVNQGSLPVGTIAGDVQPPVNRKVSQLRKHEVISRPYKREIRCLVLNLVDNVEKMVQNLHSIVGDLHDLISQIDIVTEKIERQCDKRRKTTRRGVSNGMEVEHQRNPDRPRTSRCHNTVDMPCVQLSTLDVIRKLPKARNTISDDARDNAKQRDRNRPDNIAVQHSRSNRHSRNNRPDLLSSNLEATGGYGQQHGFFSTSPPSVQTVSTVSLSPQDAYAKFPCDGLTPCSDQTCSPDAEVGVDRLPLAASPLQQHAGECQNSLQGHVRYEASKRHTQSCGSTAGQGSRLSYFRFSDSDESLPQVLCSSTPRGAMEFKFWDVSPETDSSQPVQDGANSRNMQASPKSSCHPYQHHQILEQVAVENIEEEYCPDTSLQNWREKTEQRTGSHDSLTPQMDWSYLGLTEQGSGESRGVTNEDSGEAASIYNYHNGYGVHPGFHQRLVASLPEWKPHQHHLPYWPSSELSSIKSSDDEDDEVSRSSPLFCHKPRLPSRLSETVSPLVSRKKYVVSRQANTQKTVTFCGSAEDDTAAPLVENSLMWATDSYCGVYENEMENCLEQLSGDERDASDFSDVEVDVGSDVLERSVTSCDTGELAYNPDVNTWKSYMMTRLDSDDAVSECASDILNENFIESTTVNPGFDDVKLHYDDVNFPALVY